MTGIFDGHNIEVGSTPIDRLETNIATQNELDNVISSLNTEAIARANADTLLQTNINNLDANINNNYVHKTGNLAETITGVKTFTHVANFSDDLVIQGNLTVNGTTTTVSSQDLTVSDNVIVINSDESSDHVSAGIAGISIDRGTGAAYRIIFDDSVDCVKAGFSGSEECLATKNYVDNQVGTSSGGLVALGTANFKGLHATQATVINFSPDVGSRPYSVNITPKEPTASNVGSVYYTRISGTQFKVYNTGDGTSSFDWSVGVVGILPAASGVAGGDLSGAYPNPNVVAIQGQAVSTTAPTTGQALIWNGTAWEASTSSGSPGGTAGGDLSDTYPNPGVKKIRGREVSMATPQNGNVLTWVASTASWTPQAPMSGGASDLNGLSDVSVVSPNINHILMYSNSQGKWVNLKNELNACYDVNINTPSDSQVLTYNASTSKWENKVVGVGGGTVIGAGLVSLGSGSSVYITGMLDSDVVLLSSAHGDGTAPENGGSTHQYEHWAIAHNGYFTYWFEGWSSFYYVVVRATA